MPRPAIEEWLPLWKVGGPAAIAVFAASLAIASYAIICIGPRNARGISALIVTAIVAAQRGRLLQFYAITWLAYVPGWMQATPLGQSMTDLFRRRGGLLTATWVVTAAIMLSGIVSVRPWNLRVPGDHVPGLGRHVVYPVGAVEYLRSVRFQGNLMTPFDWGAYASWKLYPAVKVSMDGRYEVAYPDAVSDGNRRIYLGEPGWENLLRADLADVVLVHNRLPLARHMPTANGWHRIYVDRAFALYARSGLSLPQVDRSHFADEGTFP
jgi:hypothetical protein